LPEEDKYFGSFSDKTFSPTEKTILFVCETRKEAAEIEIELHDFFDVAVNPQFANRAKATSTKFDTTGAHDTEETRKKKSVARSGEKNPNYGVPRTEETKKKISESLSGEKHPMYGVPRTEAQKKAHSERMSGENHPMYGRTGENHPNYGNTGALSPSSKAIIAIKPDGTELHFGSGHEAARELEINHGNLCSRYLKTGHVLKNGRFKGWRFVFENR
jgi:group I intron endonuclease